MKIYTKTGDKGESSLWGGKRVSKNSLRINAYGDVDELNSLLGVVIAQKPEKSIAVKLERIQADLMTVGSDLATPYDNDKKVKEVRLTESAVQKLEDEIDSFDKELTALTSFILPSGSLVASSLHHARTVCRRAERRAVALVDEVNPLVLTYLNRLSDWLFTAARYQNKIQGVTETPWKN